MEADHKYVLNKNIRTLSSELKWNIELEASLLETGVFGKSMLESLIAVLDIYDRSRQLFIDVQRRGPKAFNGLLLSLEKSGNEKLADFLRQEEEERRKRRQEWERKRKLKVWNEPMYASETKANINEEGKVARQPKSSTDESKVYEMCGQRKGHMLIIHSKDELKSTSDAYKMKTLFEGLGFEIKTCECSNNFRTIEEEVASFSKLQEHEDASMCVLCILLGDNNDHLVESLCVMEILNNFNNSNCPGLMGKPKLFLFQTYLEHYQNYYSNNKTSGLCGLQCGGGKAIFPDGKLTLSKSPTWEDMLVLHFCPRSDFVDCLRQTVEERPASNLRDVLDEVSEQMLLKKQGYVVKNIMFRKKLFLNG